MSPGFFILTPMMSAVPLFFIVLWLSPFGRFRFAEDDLQKAKREMPASLVLWSGILVATHRFGNIVVLIRRAVEQALAADGALACF
jgi:hypothetical protein